MQAPEQPAQTGHREGCQLQAALGPSPSPGYSPDLPPLAVYPHSSGREGLRKQRGCSRDPPQSIGKASAQGQGCQDTWQGVSRGWTPLSWGPCSPQRGHAAKR